MNFDQGQFDFDQPGDETGYHKWVDELDRQKAAFERRWGIRLGQPVRLQIRNFAKPIEGVIYLDPNHQPDPGKPPRLLIGTLTFSPHEIESLSLLRPPE